MGHGDRGELAGQIELLILWQLIWPQLRRKLAGIALDLVVAVEEAEVAALGQPGEPLRQGAEGAAMPVGVRSVA